MAKYSREQRDRAVDLYVKYERCAADVIRELGYPSKGALLSWYADRLEEERTGVPSRRGERYRRYSDEQKRAAVDHYLEYGRRPGRTMRMLGYPKSKELLMAWIDELAPGQRKLRHGPVPEKLKRKAVVAVASGRLKSHEAAAELGVQGTTVREWKRQMLAKSEEAPVARPGKRRTIVESKEPSGKPTVAPNASDAAGLADAVALMERRLAEMQACLDELDADVERQRREKKELDIEIAIRKGALKLLGKEPGADPEKPGQPREDAPRQDRWRDAGRDGQEPAARGRHRAQHVPLPARRHETPRQGRFPPGARARGVREQQAALWIQADSPGAEKHGRQGIGQTDHEAHDRKRPGTVVQKREAARLVQGRVHQSSEEPGGQGFPRRTAEHAVGHGPHGVFHPRGQGVPVPVIDCYDGMPVAWTIGTGPDSALANGMLADACSTLKDGEKPIIHSDRGYHYRWPEWIRICEDDNLTRSMSAKGCSPDNAAAEGFFGRPRQEFFHKRSFAGVSMDGFINMLDDYMVWYRDKRIKTEFGMSIMDRRRRLGLVA